MTDDFPTEAKRTACCICGKEMWRITNTHLWSAHQMTMEEYKEKFPDAIFEDPLLSVWRVRYAKGKTYEEIHGVEKGERLRVDRRISATAQFTDEEQRDIRRITSSYPKSDETKRKLSESHTVHGGTTYRERALEFYGHECMRCGKTDGDMVVHHIDYQNFPSELGNHDLSNLMVLCPSCHARLHRSLSKGTFVGIPSVEKGVHYILKGLKDEFGLDLSDENFKDTPKRVARAYYEMCCGINCDDAIDEILATSFPSTYGGMITIKDIKCYSMCPHHLLPVEYSVDVGYIPGDRVLGLSKIPRIVKLLAKAPKLQEQFTQDVVEAFKKIECKGAIVIVRGYHLCMGARGIEMPGCRTITSSIYGVLEDKDTRDEFLSMVGS